MSLIIYVADSFAANNAVDQLDLLTGNGGSVYTLDNKSVIRVANTVQFDAIQYLLSNGGFTKNVTANTITTDAPPPTGSQGVAPGLNSIIFDNMYDQSVVPGVANPQVQTIPFWLADVTQIATYSYGVPPGFPGLGLVFVNNITSVGANTSWVQLACATQDLAGTALTYQATGTALYTDGLYTWGAISASSTSLATSIMVTTASSFYVGDYILINAGNTTQEIIKIGGYSGGCTLTTSGQNFPHYVGETVYTCGRKFWAKCTVPLNAVGGEATNFINLGLSDIYVRKSRA